MNRKKYFDLIEEKLNSLAYRIESRGSLNILDLNIHSENFYLHFFNLLFGWKLQNLNTMQQNAASVDLIDKTNKIIIQVSASATKHKVESALTKDLSEYKDYTFKFISISKDAGDLRTKTFINPNNMNFSLADDIFDIPSLLNLILGMEIDQMKNVYEFLKKELKSEPDLDKTESNLTTIINILSKEDWSQVQTHYQTTPFDIVTKISYNQLNSAKTLIDDYYIHNTRIEKIYSEFNKQGVNKSISILNGIRTEYLALCTKLSPDDCFYSIIDIVTQKVRSSLNYNPIPDEELVLCVQILVVDAFIRCKIFKNPPGGTNAYS